ncbi:MAG: hypothetical protein ACRDTR_10785 [Rubrobacter sp.]
MIENMLEEGIEERGRFGTSWLIVRDGGGPMEVLTLGAAGDEETLPIFSFEEEALLFLQLSGLRGSWRASKSGIADLISVLADSCSNAGSVALDPLPEIGLRGSHYLVSLSRAEFVELLALGR